MITLVKLNQLVERRKELMALIHFILSYPVDTDVDVSLNTTEGSVNVKVKHVDLLHIVEAEIRDIERTFSNHNVSI